jgi:long-chain fatty acid transport protein
MRFALKHAALAVACMAAMPAHATNGSFLPGFGVKSTGAGGVGIAMQVDALSQIANPANAAETGMRGDIGGTFFNPKRRASMGTSTGMVADNPSANFGFNVGNEESGNPLFLMPDMGFTMPLSDRLSVGFAVSGLGGGNTSFGNNIFSSTFFVNQPHGDVEDNVGVDLIQLIAPVTVAYKLAPQHSVGASLNLAAQRFKANGLGQFATFGGSGISAYNTALTNNGYDYSYGAGVKLGWLGKFLDDRVIIGATWASRTYMSKFDKYKGLFAEQGDLDFPENYGIGLTVKPIEKLAISADVTQILFSDVNAMGNSGPGTVNDGFFFILGTLTLPGNPYRLGEDQGLGFGWRDMTVYKLGLTYEATEDLTLRAGYNYGKTPIRQQQLVFSALAPATVEKHYSVGFTYKMKGELDWEISGSYMHVPKKTLSGCDQAVVDCVSYSMSQRILGIGVGIVY